MKNYLKEFADAYSANITQIAVNCKTREDADKYLLFLDSLGYAWSETSNILDENGTPKSRWGKDKEKTCYRIKEDNPNYIAKGNNIFFENRGVLVVEYNELLSFKKSEKVVNIDDDSNDDDKTINDEKNIEDETFLCPHCSVPLAKDTKFCFACGKRVVEEKMESTPPIYTGEKPILCSLFELEVNQEFFIDKDAFANKKFRINQQGSRETEVYNGFWKQCTDEIELSFIIQNKDIIKRL